MKVVCFALKKGGNGRLFHGSMARNIQEPIANLLVSLIQNVLETG